MLEVGSLGVGLSCVYKHCTLLHYIAPILVAHLIIIYAVANRRMPIDRPPSCVEVR